jgi:hypothetical protein
MGFTISTKSSNSPPPRQLSLLPPPSGTNRFHSVDWWDDCFVSHDGPTYSNKIQRSLTISTPKNNIPSTLRDTRPYAHHKFLKENQGVLINFSSPNNKLKILIKVHVKIHIKM